MVVNNKEFKQVPTHQMYYISTDGEVYSTIRKRILKPGRNNGGYRQVYLVDDDGFKRWERIHYLVAATYIDNPEELPEINHIDGNKDNNTPDNLEWCTRLHNQRHASRLGLFPKNRKGRPSGFTHSQEIKEQMSEMKKGKNHPKYTGDYVTPEGTFSSANLAGEKNGLAGKTVKRRCTNKAWLHLGWNFIPKQFHPDEDIMLYACCRIQLGRVII